MTPDEVFDLYMQLIAAKGWSIEYVRKLNVFLVCEITKRLMPSIPGLAGIGAASRKVEPPANDMYTSGMRWEGTNLTRTISFGDIGKMSDAEMANFNRNVVKNPKAVMGD
jgi:hypothetical protein